MVGRTRIPIRGPAEHEAGRRAAFAHKERIHRGGPGEPREANRRCGTGSQRRARRTRTRWWRVGSRRAQSEGVRGHESEVRRRRGRTTAAGEARQMRRPHARTSGVLNAKAGKVASRRARHPPCKQKGACTREGRSPRLARNTTRKGGAGCRLRREACEEITQIKKLRCPRRRGRNARAGA